MFRVCESHFAVVGVAVGLLSVYILSYSILLLHGVEFCFHLLIPY